MKRILLYTYSFAPINGSSDPIKDVFDLINQTDGKEDDV